MAGNRLLPSRSTVERGDGSRVVGIREDAADEVFEALSSSTAREILAALYEEPDTASSVADDVGTSLQNATYHLEKLVAADLVEVADTWYSEQGREMNVYAPASESLVVFAADEASKPSLKERLLRVLGAVGVLGVASLVVQRLFGGQGAPTDYQTTGGSGDTAAATTDGGGIGIMNEQATETAQATTTAATTASQSAAQGLPPGVLFFAGGLLVLAVVLGYVWYRGR
ncbi:ArsR/SmtB family transcription factor [Halobacterium sp. KA-6]|jgi:DNA-binding transcriptional ArsR family regulator|uniref:ArsR/SmtB family transcription factor n=1 Tax=Halobacterium sp. KA-6 TaxID=2896368 RepID=UPI001E3D066E|nr:helix-turn-helix domain-containing protein [Halobacterium sp. KA-6]MCD2202276.1 helix-turn-helix domain-containing protein [Halobacterium sp. KA-6]